jgi:hypothetical protein
MPVEASVHSRSNKERERVNLKFSIERKDMAGRGCIITVKLLGGSNGTGETEELTLPVALHSPLIVLRQQLYQIVSIAPTDQVLILCDMSDPDRNSDLLLTGRDDMTLHECGIQHGSILTLHALGLSAEKKQQLLIAAFAEKLNEKNPNIQVLETDISPADADHRYFDSRKALG